MRSGGGARAAGLAVLGLVLALALLLQILPSGSGAEGPSASSVAPRGRWAAFRLLGAVGWDVEAWTRAPGELPSDGHVLFLAGVPEDPPGYAATEGGRLDPPPGARRVRDPLHYLRFLQEGGTLIAPFTRRHARFLEERLGLVEIEGLETLKAERGASQEEAFELVRLATGESLRVDRRGKRFARLGLASPFHAVAAGPDGRALIVAERVGRGSLVLIAHDRFLDNAELGTADHAVLLVRLIESQRPTGRILFDEYSLGGWVPESPLELAFAADVRGFTLHLVALALLAAWSAAWVRQFPRDPEPLEHLAPLDRARAHAGWIAAAGRHDLLARMLQVGVLRRLARRGGGELPELRPRGEDAAEEAAAGSGAARPREHARLELDEPAVRRVLAPFAARLGGEREVEVALGAFARSRVRDEDGLERLARDVARLETALAGTEEV